MHRLPDDNEDNAAPFQIYLGVHLKANSYTADQSPCWWGNHLSEGILSCSGALLSFTGLI